MVEGQMLWSIAGVIVGGLVAALLGMQMNKLDGIQRSIKGLEDRFFQHVTDPELHHSGLGKISEHLKSVESKVDVAHQRIDRLKEAAG